MGVPGIFGHCQEGRVGWTIQAVDIFHGKTPGLLAPHIARSHSRNGGHFFQRNPQSRTSGWVASYHKTVMQQSPLLFVYWFRFCLPVRVIFSAGYLLSGPWWYAFLSLQGLRCLWYYCGDPPRPFAKRWRFLHEPRHHTRLLRLGQIHLTVLLWVRPPGFLYLDECGCHLLLNLVRGSSGCIGVPQGWSGRAQIHGHHQVSSMSRSSFYFNKLVFNRYFYTDCRL